MALAAGVACGGDDDERDSRSSRSSDRETSSSEDSEAREDEDRDSSGSGVLGGFGSDRTGRGVSVQDLGSAPNLQYDRLVLVDVSALLYGDVPKELATVPGIREIWLELKDLLGSTEDNPIEVYMADVETFIALEWGHWYYDERLDDIDGEAFTIKGDYGTDAIRDSLSASNYSEQMPHRDTGPELWRVSLSNWDSESETVAFVDDRVYGVNDSVEDSSAFLETLDEDDWLLEDSESPIVRAIERLGSGWLVLAKTDYCDNDCLVSAFAVSTASESAIEATWVALFENSELATAAKEYTEEGIASGNSIINYAGDGLSAEETWITDVDTDGEFLVLEASVPMDEASEFFDRLVATINYPNPESTERISVGTGTGHKRDGKATDRRIWGGRASSGPVAGEGSRS